MTKVVGVFTYIYIVCNFLDTKSCTEDFSACMCSHCMRKVGITTVIAVGVIYNRVAILWVHQPKSLMEEEVDVISFLEQRGIRCFKQENFFVSNYNGVVLRQKLHRE